MASEKKGDTLCFFVNGRKVTETHADPETTLLSFLREKRILLGLNPSGGFLDCGPSEADRNQVRLRRRRLRGVHRHGVTPPAGHREHHVSFRTNTRSSQSHSAHATGSHWGQGGGATG
ncbi:Xanthine dehydrogenase [Liparis tanakae]|uniref:Xanthine dehydrogenase n=1 Tax=Liparis tanakae TaxID=230148 RepID=A0A4Z2EQD4_9TELE|nr:Xanthine dehydrogenase [Liparis tanakae]